MLLKTKNKLIIRPSIKAAIINDKAFDTTKLNLLLNFCKADVDQYNDIISDESEANIKPFTILPSI